MLRYGSTFSFGITLFYFIYKSLTLISDLLYLLDRISVKFSLSTIYLRYQFCTLQKIRQKEKTLKNSKSTDIV